MKAGSPRNRSWRHRDLLRHADAASEEVGHQAGFQVAELLKLILFMTAYQCVVLTREHSEANPFLLSAGRGNAKDLVA